MYRRVDVFSQSYKVNSYGYIGRDELNYSGKILLPPSALAVMSNMTLIYPLTFSLHKYNNSTVITHCGVLEFTASEAHCIVPAWMLRRLNLSENDYITVTTLALPRASFIRFKPTSIEFFKIPNYKVVFVSFL